MWVTQVYLSKFVLIAVRNHILRRRARNRVSIRVRVISVELLHTNGQNARIWHEQRQDRRRREIVQQPKESPE
jgi:hypothetical protein